MKSIQSTGLTAINSIAAFGRAGLFLIHVMLHKPKSFSGAMNLLIKQIYSVGVLSLVIINCFWAFYRYGTCSSRLYHFS